MVHHVLTMHEIVAVMFVGTVHLVTSSPHSTGCSLLTVSRSGTEQMQPAPPGSSSSVAMRGLASALGTDLMQFIFSANPCNRRERERERELEDLPPS